MTDKSWDFQESSALYQAHPNQLFSRNRLSFQVSKVFEDNNRILEFNPEKFKPLILEELNKRLAERKTEGYDFPQLSDIKIIYPLLVSNKEEGGQGCSGRYVLFPRRAICRNCHKYIRLDRGEKCTCAHPDFRHFTFVAFCDDCGASYPIDAMSNIGRDCSKCGSPNSLTKIYWGREDELMTYRVACDNCGERFPLRLFKCDHTDHQKGGKVRSTKPHRSFRGVPSRAGAIFHPYVITVPDIPQVDETEIGGVHNIIGREFTDAFNKFFKSLGSDESRLALPEFWGLLTNKDEFWNNPRVQMVLEDLKLDPKKRLDWNNADRWRALRTVIIQARSTIIRDGKGSENIPNVSARFSLNSIGECLISVSTIPFSEESLQGLLLVSGGVSTSADDTITKRRDTPVLAHPNWTSVRETFGLENVTLITNLYLVQILVGMIEGAGRRIPMLFTPINSGNPPIPTAYIRRFQTEGIVFTLDSSKVLDWLNRNEHLGETIGKTSDRTVEIRSLIRNNDQVKKSINVLLHTFAHLLIQESSIDTGLDAQNLSEIIFPDLLSFAIYATGSINTGGLESTFDKNLVDWLSRIGELAADCPQDPGCMEDEGGACLACLFLPEFACRYFNQDLDRSSLVGGGRFGAGFFDKV